ncbi:MAG: tyrosine-type recombinase/integrase [Betaproteobacteria bacterium]
MPGGISSRALNKLSDLKIRSFISKTKAGNAPATKLSDGGGMYLAVTPAGTPVWRVKYRLGGREKLYAIGTYPDITLDAARAEREAIKGRLREGRDPVQARKLDRAAATTAGENTFETVTHDWLEKQRQGWSGIHYDKSKRASDRDVLPRLGKLPVSDITPAMVAGIIEAIVKRGARDTAARVLQHIGGVFRLAQARGLCRENPAVPVREVLPRKKENGRRPAFLEWKALGAVLRGAEAARLSPAVRMAHRLCAFTAARISNVVMAEWREFDLDADVPVWIIPRKKMKAQDRAHDHKVILGPVIAAEPREWRSVIGGKGYVFPSPAKDKHITRESLEKVYRVTLELEDKHTPHGWRAAFSTLARDNGFDRDVVELALDHLHDNEVVRAYDRGERLQQRVKLKAWWGDQLAQAERGADVVAIRKAS